MPVEIDLVISDQSLLGGGNESAHLGGYGPIPASLARQLAVHAADAKIATLRRLYTNHGALTALESRARCFPSGLKRFLTLRDQTCRTPWCDAPIRHYGHVVAFQDGEPTTPTGHTYTSTAPELPRAASPPSRSPAQRIGQALGA